MEDADDDAAIAKVVNSNAPNDVMAVAGPRDLLLRLLCPCCCCCCCCCCGGV